jgi:hypothetical protein
MTDLARTPEPPYYAVIFTSRRAAEHEVRVARVERARSFAKTKR